MKEKSASASPTAADFDRLQRRVERVQATLETLIAWMVGSSVSPISKSEAMQLLRKSAGD